MFRQMSELTNHQFSDRVHTFYRGVQGHPGDQGHTGDTNRQGRYPVDKGCRTIRSRRHNQTVRPQASRGLAAAATRPPRGLATVGSLISLTGALRGTLLSATGVFCGRWSAEPRGRGRNRRWRPIPTIFMAMRLTNRRWCYSLIDVINDLEFPGSDQLVRFAIPMGQRIAALKKRARQAKVPIIYVNDNFGAGKAIFTRKWSTACRTEWPASPWLNFCSRKKRTDFVLKPKHSGFYSTTLGVLLEHLGAARSF